MIRGTIFRAAVLAAFLAAVAAAAAAFAENVDPNNDNSQFAWGENVGWINAEPNAAGNPGVTVTGSGVTGYMWGENIGWINMSCLNNATCGSTGNYGVRNNGLGVLAGYAWGENVGWISFNCANTGSCGISNYGVTIDPANGTWNGFAWGENIGWISFSDTAPVAYKVQTDDGDGVPGASDNCAFDAPGDQTNTDAAARPNAPAPSDNTIANHDDFGNVCDTDDDNDGLSDTAEAVNPVCASSTGATDPLLADTDGDRVRDRAECLMGFNPLDALSKPSSVPAGDTDQDGLPSALETDVLAGILSDPNNPDTDNDGALDGVEFRGYSASPTDATTDNDSCPDDTEITSVNGDKVTNVLDLLIVAQSFNQVRPVSDVNQSGNVNVIDLQFMAANATLDPC